MDLILWRHAEAEDEQEGQHDLSRVFYFRAGTEEELYLSSADWMNRNMLRRIELTWPVNDPHLRQRIIDECLVAYLHDDRDAWDLQADGTYQRVQGACEPKGHGAQAALMERYAARNGSAQEGAWT